MTRWGPTMSDIMENRESTLWGEKGVPLLLSLSDEFSSWAEVDCLAEERREIQSS